MSLGFHAVWASTREIQTLLLANNKCTDQPAHPRSLISASIIRYLRSKATGSDVSYFFYLFFFGGGGVGWAGFNMIQSLATPLRRLHEIMVLITPYSAIGPLSSHAPTVSYLC